MDYNFPLYLTYGEKVFSIEGYVEENTDEYIPNKGYIDKEKEIVLIFSKNENKMKFGPNVPYFWIEDGKVQHSDLTEKMYDVFSVQNIKDLNLDVIEEVTDINDELYDEELIISINNSTSVFKPEIKDSDDFLKKLVKQVILDKGIDIKMLDSKLGKKNGLNNLKSALLGTTKMSTTNFIIWAELLGIEWTIMISNNGTDKVYPLKEDLLYMSSNDRIVKMKN